MKVKLLFLFTVIIGIANAQQTTFSKVLWDAPQSGITENAFCRAVDNGYILAGTSNSGQGLIIKIDSAANPIWNKTIGANAVFNDISSTNDSCYILVGTINNSSGMYTDAFCVKINSFGNILWSKTITVGKSLNIIAVHQTSDSGYIMTGYLNFSGPSSSKVFIAKLAASGNYQWSTLLTAGNNDNRGLSVKQTTDSGFVVAGFYSDYPPLTYHTFLLKLSSLGAFSWAKSYSTTSFLSGNDVEIVNNGFLLYGNDQGMNVSVMKIDFYGNVLWSKLYPISAMGPGNGPCKIHKTIDSCYVFVSGNCGGGSIIKIDSTGNTIWSKTLMLGAVDVLESKDKGFFITGNGPMCGVKTPILFSPPYSSQIGIIKTDSLGSSPSYYCVNNTFNNATDNPLTGSAVTFTSSSGGTISQVTPLVNSMSLVLDLGCVSVYGGVDENNLNDDFSITPNPTTGIFSIQSSEKISAIQIVNLLGEIVYFSKMNYDKSEIDLSKEPNGVYFLQITTDKGIARKKIVISK